MDYTSYFDNLLNSELVQSIPNLSSSGHLSISNILGHSIKNKNFYKKKYKNLDTLGFIDKKTNIIKNNILDISSKNIILFLIFMGIMIGTIKKIIL
jgi:hypothetical protein